MRGFGAGPRPWLRHAGLVPGLAATLLAAAPAGAVEIEHDYGLEASVAGDDNINRASKAGDIREDKALSLSANLLYRFEINQYHGLLARIAGEYEAWEEFDELNRLALEASLSWRMQVGSGFGAMTLEPSVKLGLIDSETDNRDQHKLTLGATLARRLTDRMILLGGIETSQAESDDSEVFDLAESSLFLNLDLLLSNESLIYATYRFIDGDVVSTATPDINIIEWAEVIEPDPAFGGDAANQFAYRLQAETQLLTLGYNHALDHDTAFDLSLRTLTSSAQGGIDYDRLQVRASLLHRFE